MPAFGLSPPGVPEPRMCTHQGRKPSPHLLGRFRGPTALSPASSIRSTSITPELISLREKLPTGGRWDIRRTFGARCPPPPPPFESVRPLSAAAVAGSILVLLTTLPSRSSFFHIPSFHQTNVWPFRSARPWNVQAESLGTPFVAAFFDLMFEPAARERPPAQASPICRG